MTAGAAIAFGPRRVDDGRVRFALWAPDCECVSLEIERREPLPMQKLPDGWFEALTQAEAGTRYRFRVRPHLAIPDPASRFQPDDVHGYSELIDSSAYRWEHPNWRGRPWAETVIYELHVGTLGGYAGVRRQLPRLAELGVTAIQFMPIADFRGARNWGYDGVLPYAPDAAYGRPEELKALIDAAHGMGLMVFLDVVYNHFGPEGNYLPTYAPDFFRDDCATPWGNTIDFRQPTVRQFFIQNALYWLTEYRFDGLRLDAVHGIRDATFVDELGTAVRAAMPPDRHVHLMLENENNEARYLEERFDAQWNDDGHNVLHVLLTGEADGYYADFTERPADKLARCLREGFVYQGEPCPSRNGGARGSPSAHLGPERFILFLQNHDQIGNRAFGERLTALAHPDALRAAASLQLLCPQIPLLFMGEEWGSRTPFLYFTDFDAELAEAVRNGRRDEFARFRNFAGEQARERIPDPNAPETFVRSVPDFLECESPRHAEALAFYRWLLRLRARVVVPRLTGTRALAATVLGERAVSAAWRLGDGSRLSTVCNLGPESVSVERADAPLLFESLPGAGVSIRGGVLPAYATCCYFTDAGP